MNKQEIIARVNYLKSLYGSYNRDEYDKYMEDCEEIDALLEELEERFPHE